MIIGKIFFLGTLSTLKLREFFFKNKFTLIKTTQTLTLSAVAVGIPRVTPLVTLPSLFVTQRTIQTVTTAIVDTTITIGTVITFYKCTFWTMRFGAKEE